MNTQIDCRTDKTEIFWGEIAPCEHLVQLYTNDDIFLDALEGFIGGGLHAGDGIILIATPAHLQGLEKRLLTQGFNVSAARARDQYIALDAAEVLSQFMAKGWPDEALFQQFVYDLLTRARGNGRQVRAFGEMVAILWAQGHNGATLELERLWHVLCQKEAFSLFCAYPRSGFTQDTHESIQEIRATHSQVIEA